MYTVYVDGNLIYSSENYLLTNEYTIYNPKLSQEIGHSGQLTFIVPEENNYYSKFKLRRSKVEVYRNEKIFWRGRVFDVNKDFYKNKEVVCEGALGYLNDTIQDPVSKKIRLSALFKSAVENHNKRVDQKRQFIVGEFTINDQEINHEEGYIKTMQLFSNLQEDYGGFFTITYTDKGNVINWLGDIVVKADQPIRIQSNLTDLVQNTTGEDIVTCLIATGKDDKKLEGVSIRNDLACELFEEVWDYVSFSDIEKMDELKDTAEKYLDELVWASMEIKISAVDLSDEDDTLDCIEIGKNYRLISEEHNIIHWFPCSSMDIDLSNKDNNQYTLGAKTIWSQLDDQKDYDEMIKANAKIKTIKSKSISSRAAKTESKVQTSKVPFSGRVAFSDNTNLVFESGLLVSGTTLEGEF